MKNKIKVYHILNSLLPSGAETMLVNSAELWKNCELHIVATAKELGSYASEFEKAGYIVHHIHKESFIKQHLAMRNFFKKEKPDVVHIHRESQDCYYALDAKLAGVKRIVRTVHSVFSFNGLLKFRRICTRFFARLLGTRYITIGESVYENEINRFHNKIHKNIDNWCDETKYSYISLQQKLEARKILGINEKTYVVVSVGNCSPVKNHKFVLNALKFLKEKYENLNLKYYHIGSGDLEKEEIDFVNKINLGNCVEFIGRADPVQYYKLADLNVMPSLYEGFSISALEAVTCGIRSLFTEVNGLKDFKNLKSKDIFFSKLEQQDFNINFEKLYIEFNYKGNLVNSKELSTLAQNKYNRKKSVEFYLNIYTQ